ncbi:MAG: hypothetical protein GXZ08_05410 [Tissierellia bacterium]|nr:hypothetical protein [Tissierellia bacterium]
MEKKLEFLSEEYIIDSARYSEFYNYFIEELDLISPQIVVLQELLKAFSSLEKTIEIIYANELTIDDVLNFYYGQKALDGDVNETS